MYREKCICERLQYSSLSEKPSQYNGCIEENILNFFILRELKICMQLKDAI